MHHFCIHINFFALLSIMSCHVSFVCHQSHGYSVLLCGIVRYTCFKIREWKYHRPDRVQTGFQRRQDSRQNPDARPTNFAAYFTNHRRHLSILSCIWVVTVVIVSLFSAEFDARMQEMTFSKILKGSIPPDRVGAGPLQPIALKPLL